MRRCELCSSPARIFCESDQASLCWNCDFKVHGANFLVARHTRNLLCQNCQSSTPWSASGANLTTATVSLCIACSTARPVCDEIDLYAAADTDNDDDDDNIGGSDEDEEISSSMPPPPPEITSSSDEDEDTFLYPSIFVRS